ncbi:cobaltochelatase subunit CobN [Thauera linaloolentis]|uniref:CobN/magnesium chelatase n=1 Tax=Thauera linaloolentis (strain DSM 12138 / JCM 21573 / CCUG 41526 / CIP 105981 / IAM 15112 / NBRC 102519 / 47Lol) TaxID=1123367 RepID=N6XTT0_THAL4|nr:cobaltochelatase subunit CobN [Thauera linaloolentis]ENO85151.1 CobN/magnesium chelatase [Thauera linaloolentis 47Lol = DSM 12138]MCM8564447.1 cobaltochelatase subunit CobN [Thauera linaloolentis]
MNQPSSPKPAEAAANPPPSGKGRHKALLFVLAALLAVAVAVLALRTEARAPRVAVVSSDFVLAGKFTALGSIGNAAGVDVDALNIDRDDDARISAALAGAELALLDAPREEDGRRLLERMAPLLERAGVPWLLSSARGPQAGGGLDAAHGEALHNYYRNGGQRNFAGLFAYVRHHLAGDRGIEVPAPLIYPEAGFYHPDHPDQVVADLAAYRAWLGAERAGHRPAVGIAIHRAYIGNLGMAHVDELVRRLEARGALPVVYYHPATAGAGALELLYDGEGRPAVELVINLQVMYQASRREDYLRLGVPVLQALTWRGGDADDWRASEVGVASGGVPFYLAIPELAGLTDPLMVAAIQDGDAVLIPEQADALVDKVFKLIRLRTKAQADKRVALMFYNYPPGEKNLSASFMNVPRSLALLTDTLRGVGYTVDALDEQAMVSAAADMLAPFYRPDFSRRLDELLTRGLAARLPLADYLAWYGALPAAVRERIEAHWGAPAADPMLTGAEGERAFAIPRLQLGNLVILPQPPRGRVGEPAEKAIYHDTRVPLTHFYLAAYLYARAQFDADALIHFGTHGSQEWTPGKERGLSVYDDPYLALGDTPIIYPYIVDNIGEATQAKRRGRATIISHQTPSFAPAGLHEKLMPLHDLLHEYGLLDDGAVKERTLAAIVDEAARLKLIEDIGWTAERARADFVPFERELHDWLHALAQTAQPLGLHTFGQAPQAEHRLSTTMQMLGERLYGKLGLEDPKELFVDDFRKLAESPPYRLLAGHLLDAGQPAPADPALAELLAEARGHFGALSAAGEHAGLLAALDGRFIDTHYGGDPVRNPESLPTGRNLYGFDPSRLPTEQAYAAGGEAFAQLLAAHRAEHGTELRKLALSLWSVEAMRHLGVLEAQAFHALGVKPVWDRFGRISDVQVIPRAELGRPRVDVVLSATGLYRDHFPNVMLHLARAVELVAELDEPDNAVRTNTLALEKRLLEQGLSAEDAREYALTRIFSNQSGTYGTGLEDAALATDSWEDEGKLAELYLARMQYAFGPTEARWGEKPEKLNLYAEQLQGVEAAVLARSSNLYGMLTTDDPFQYLGGIGLAVRHLGGKTPGLYISNLRDAAKGKVESAERFLAAELRARYFHPQWIGAMQQEGHAGTLNVVDTVNNFWGWTTVAPEIVRDDQWQSFFDVYIDDALDMKMDEWFEQHNPTARAQIAERMLEAVRKEYWQTDEQTLRKLVEVYQDAVERLDYLPASSMVGDYAQALAAGFGLEAASDAAPSEAAAGAAAPEAVTGQVLEQVQAEQGAAPAPWFELLLAALTLLAFLGGMLRQTRAPAAAR